MNPAREKALSYLSRFSRTERQVSDYLARKQFTPEQISDAIVYLREHRFVNDDAFAEVFIQEKIRRKDGPMKIRQMLFQKGIPPQISEKYLREFYPVERQLENAEALLRQRMTKRKSSKPTRIEREKLLRFVASRGFPRYVIIQAFKSL